ncbi:hypothetical protein NEMBOFW57_004338 [Staphylotrichum longicolle]|uniref:Prion-inhibition and propagation HeLo domain-containing protein n=1 Tax=Staphylotrichum longicolle TaxID=669026 RepID=A0AAD4F664_9PEZI|nr:hypothetical protein NEMBOFW57_004338 [Staphylotrichum longicolle]
MEPFGILASALSVAGLFNNCVDCFEYIQLGRHFERDYATCQLKLDVAKLRLTRWGEAVKINDDLRFQSIEPGEKSVKWAQSLIRQIIKLFDSAWETSNEYELVTDQQNLVVFEDKDMKPVERALHNQMKVMADRRLKRHATSLSKKIAWALYGRKSLERIIEGITGLIDGLEKAFPAEVEAVRHKLVEIEIEEVEDEASLTVLKDAAVGIDTALSNAAAQKMNAIVGSNFAKEIRTEDRAMVHVGNVFTETTLQREVLIREQTINAAGTVVAKGESGIQIGNTYGGNGFWNRS